MSTIEQTANAWIEKLGTPAAAYNALFDSLAFGTPQSIEMRAESDAVLENLLEKHNASQVVG